MRIAMWSGPRNLSTAMMYAFAARGDCAVVDEPFYAAFLADTGADHPMRDAVLRAHETDPAKIARRLAGPIPDGKPHFYQKQMPHHMSPDYPMDWAEGVRHVFLIRHPARVIASYVAKSENPSAEELGFLQQERMFDAFVARGLDPLVIDSGDIRADPARALGALCAALGLPYSERMLHWPAGGRPEDGVWAAHWYGAVHRSTGFAGPEGPLPALSGDHATMAELLLPAYDRLKRQAMRIFSCG